MRARLEEWMWFRESKRLYGYIFGHPNIEDGCTIWTEGLTEVDFERKIARSARNTYELGSEYNLEVENSEWPR
jgi:hypothetical protein